MKTMMLVLATLLPLSSVAQFIAPDQIIPPASLLRPTNINAGMVMWAKCNSSWFSGTQSRCYRLNIAPSNVMWCHCQFKCVTFATPLEAGYKIWWSVPAGETGQGELFSKNYPLYGSVYGDLTIYCGLNGTPTGAGYANADCDTGEVYWYPFSVGCSGGGDAI